MDNLKPKAQRKAMSRQKKSALLKIQTCQRKSYAHVLEKNEDNDSSFLILLLEVALFKTIAMCTLLHIAELREFFGMKFLSRNLSCATFLLGMALSLL